VLISQTALRYNLEDYSLNLLYCENLVYQHKLNFLITGNTYKLFTLCSQHAEEMKRRTLLLKVPKDAFNSRKKRRAVNEMHCDYLKRQQRPANRRRTDPVVVLSTILESILNEMRDLPDVQPFLFPVNAKVRSNFVSISSKAL
jgi:transcription initiation factor TFIID subunit 1